MKDLSFSEETDLCCSVVLDRSPLRAQVRAKLFPLSFLKFFFSPLHFLGYCLINLVEVRCLANMNLYLLGLLHNSIRSGGVG